MCKSRKVALQAGKILFWPSKRGLEQWLAISCLCWNCWYLHAHSVEITIFSVIQIFREINFSDCRCSKTDILKISRALNFYFNVFLQFMRAKIYQRFKLRDSKTAKWQIFYFYSFWNWFKVKFDWHKNTEISTLRNYGIQSPKSKHSCSVDFIWIWGFNVST